MSSTTTITVQVGNAVPQGNDQESRRIIGLWQDMTAFFAACRFTAPEGIGGKARPYMIALDAGSLLQKLEDASAKAGSFDDYRREHASDASLGIDATLAITITSSDHPIEEEEGYQVASIFLQQLVMLANIMLPGSIQLLDTRFTGAGAHRYEAQAFDSRIFHGAGKSAAYNEWPQLPRPALAKVWAWLEACETSHTDTAISDINKVLFTLLKVAEQRHEYSARTVLLVIYQLEVLLDCRHVEAPALIRNHARMVLGNIPQAADPINELCEVRHNLFRANQPVHRPPLICNNTAVALQKQIGQHNSAVEAGTALVLALLHDLIAHDARTHVFTESMSRQ
jgi:hypothetical protein